MRFAAYLFLLGLVALLIKLLFPFLSGTELKPEVLGTIIPALLVVIGWLGTFVMQEHRKVLVRNERQKDLKFAFRAEIWDFLQTYEYANTEEFGKAIQQKIIDGGDGCCKYHPFVPKEKIPRVFDVLSHSIEHLPPETVNEVVQFYGQLSDLSIFADDLRSSRLEQLSFKRRAAAYGDYIEMKSTAYNLAVFAHAKLEESLGVKPHRATDAAIEKQKQTLILWINSQAAGQDDQG